MSIKKALLFSLLLRLCVVFIGILLLMGNYLFGKPWRTVEDIRSLIHNGEKVDTYNNDGITNLMTAALAGDLELLKKLLAAGANVEQTSRTNERNTVLYLACYNGNYPKTLEIAKYLIEYGADVRAKNNNGDTPIHALLQIGDIPSRLNLLTMLIKHGADINVQNKQKNTMLHLAIELLDQEWINTVLNTFGYLVNFNLKNDKGFALKEYATNFGFTDILAVLEQKIKVIGLENSNATDSTGLTALMLAIIKGDEKFSKELIAKGANVNKPSEDEYRNVALHYAILSQRISFIPLLLKSGANPNIKNNKGDAPIHYLVRVLNKNEQKNAAKMLLSNNSVNGNIQNNEGNTLLHLAVLNRDESLIVDLSVSFGFKLDPFIKNNNEKTALAIAKEIQLPQAAIKALDNMEKIYGTINPVRAFSQ